MKVTRGAIGIVCATIALVTIAVRTQSNRPPFGAAVTDEQVEMERPAISSRVQPVVNTEDLPGLYGADLQANTSASKRPAKNVDRVDQPVTSDESPAVASNEADDTIVYDDSEAADETMAYAMENPSPVPPSPYQLTDREMIDRLVAEMDPNEQRNFRATWVLMTPSERQDFLASLRG